MKTVFILVGPKGTGKSFIGDLIQRRLGIHFLRVEPIFLRTIKGSALKGSELEAQGYSAVFKEIESVLNQHEEVVIESTGASDAFPFFLEKIKKQYRVVLISIRTPLDSCLKRVKSRDQSIHIPVSDDRVSEINERAIKVNLPWDLIIDNSGPASADAIIDQFQRILSIDR